MPRPNILLIMTDQHHAGCVGYAGHPDVRTPHIDRLAETGVRFADAFTCHGTCVPSRVSYMTGMWPHAHGVYAGEPNPIPDRLVSLPAWLRLHGYRTGLIGKKHLPNWNTLGFEHECVCYTADGPTRNLHYYNYLKRHGLHALYDDLGDVEKFCLGAQPVPVEHSLENWTADETIRYLRDEAGGGPFFLMASFERPHPPLSVPTGCPFAYDPASLTLPENQRDADSSFFFNRNVELKWRASVHGEGVLREALAAYYSLISLIDHNVGRILDCLDERGLRENTVVVFCSDHGDFAGEYGRMAKGYPYDALQRIPFVWNWPERFCAGKAEEGFAQNTDFFPTVCDLAGLPVPRSVQGGSLREALTGSASTGRDAVFCESVCVKTVRTKAHKLNYAFTRDGEVAELYDLAEDPHEYRNVYEEPAHAEARDALHRRLLDWWIATQQPPNCSRVNERYPSSRWFDGAPNRRFE